MAEPEAVAGAALQCEAAVLAGGWLPGWLSLGQSVK